MNILKYEPTCPAAARHSPLLQSSEQPIAAHSAIQSLKTAITKQGHMQGGSTVIRECKAGTSEFPFHDT